MPAPAEVSVGQGYVTPTTREAEDPSARKRRESKVWINDTEHVAVDDWAEVLVERWRHEEEEFQNACCHEDEGVFGMEFLFPFGSIWGW